MNNNNLLQKDLLMKSNKKLNEIADYRQNQIISFIQSEIQIKKQSSSNVSQAKNRNNSKHKTQNAHNNNFKLNNFQVNKLSIIEENNHPRSNMNVLKHVNIQDNIGKKGILKLNLNELSKNNIIEDEEISGRSEKQSSTLINKIYNDTYSEEHKVSDNVKTNEKESNSQKTSIISKLFTLLKGIKTEVKPKEEDNEICESQENFIKPKKTFNKKVTFVKIFRNSLEETQQWDQLLNEDTPLLSKAKHYNSNPRSLKIEGKVYDSLSEHENHEEIVKMTDFRKLSIHPKSTFMQYYTIILNLALILSCTIVPFIICFQDSLLFSTTGNSIGVAIDIVLIIDLFIRFFLGFYKEDDIIFDFKEVTINYLISGFFFNVIISFPFYIIIEIVSTHYSFLYDPLSSLHGVYILHICSWGRWFRFLALVKLWQNITFLIYKVFEVEEYALHVKKILIVKASMFFLLVLHNLTCLWIYIGRSQDSSSNWLDKFGFTNKSNLEVYFASFNFNMVTILSVGYGDIYPTTHYERIFICCYMFFSTMIYSFIVSWMSSIISESSKKQIIFNHKKNTLNKIISDYKLPSTLEKQLRKSLSFMEKNYTADIHALLNILPDKLKSVIYKKIFHLKIGELDFYKETSEEFILYCSQRIELVSLKKTETLISIGDIFTEMYMVSKGNLNFYLGSIYNDYRINSIGKGYHFGDVNMYLNGPSDYTIKAAATTNEIFSLKKTVYSELKRNFPEIIESIIKKSIDNFSNLELLRKEACFYYENNGNLDGFRYIINKKLQANHCNSLQKSDVNDLFNTAPDLNIEHLTELIEGEEKKGKNDNIFKIGNKTLMMHRNSHMTDEMLDSISDNEDSDLNNRPIKNKSSKNKSTIVLNMKNRITTYNIIKRNVDGILKINSKFPKKIYDEEARKGIKKLIRKHPTDKIVKKHNENDNKIKVYCYKDYLEDNVSSHFAFSTYINHDFQEFSINRENKYFRSKKETVSEKEINSSNSISSSSSTFSIEKDETGSTPCISNKRISLSFSDFSKIACKNKNFSINYIGPKRSNTLIIKPISSLNCIKQGKLQEIRKFTKQITKQKEGERKKRSMFMFYKDFNIMQPITSSDQERKNNKNYKASNTINTKNKRNSRFYELDKNQMMKDFCRRIDKNAFFDNNLNIYEGYLKNFIEVKSNAIKDKEGKDSTLTKRKGVINKIDSGKMLEQSIKKHQNNLLSPKKAKSRRSSFNPDPVYFHD